MREIPNVTATVVGVFTGDEPRTPVCRDCLGRGYVETREDLESGGHWTGSRICEYCQGIGYRFQREVLTESGGEIFFGGKVEVSA